MHEIAKIGVRRHISTVHRKMLPDPYFICSGKVLMTLTVALMSRYSAINMQASYLLTDVKFKMAISNWKLIPPETLDFIVDRISPF